MSKNVHGVRRKFLGEFLASNVMDIIYVHGRLIQNYIQGGDS